MNPNNAFPHAKLRGAHRDIGRRHGEMFRTLIHTYLDVMLCGDVTWQGGEAFTTKCF